MTPASGGTLRVVSPAAASSPTSHAQVLLHHPALVIFPPARPRRIKQPDSVHRQLRERRCHVAWRTQPVERPAKPPGNRRIAVAQCVPGELLRVEFVSVLFEDAQRLT